VGLLFEPGDGGCADLGFGGEVCSGEAVLAA
jgi:hypothetical protein